MKGPEQNKSIRKKGWANLITQQEKGWVFTPGTKSGPRGLCGLHAVVKQKIFCLIYPFFDPPPPLKKCVKYFKCAVIWFFLLDQTLHEAAKQPTYCLDHSVLGLSSGS